MYYYFQALQKYAVFSGRARRSEYWYFVLFNSIFAFVFAVMCGLWEVPELASLYQFIFLIPSLAVGVRRMHDVGKSGWYLCIPLYNLILTLTEGDTGENEYGPDPRTE